MSRIEKQIPIYSQPAQFSAHSGGRLELIPQLVRLHTFTHAPSGVVNHAPLGVVNHAPLGVVNHAPLGAIAE